MKKKETIIKHSIKKSMPTKKRSDEKAVSGFTEEFFDLVGCTMKPINSMWLDKLGKAEYDWASTDEEAYVMEQFFIKMGIHETDFYRWVEKYPQLERWHSASLSALGARREIGGLKKKLSEGIVSYTAAHYNKRCWKSLAEWRSNMSKAENAIAIGNKQYIVLPEYPSCEEVKPRKTPEQVAAEARKIGINSREKP